MSNGWWQTEHIKNVRVFGGDETLIASGYPHRTEIEYNTELNFKEHKKRAERLGKVPTGTGHDNFLKGIVVQFDWRKSLLIERQILRYHWMEIVSSQSTMHSALHMKVSEQCNEYVNPKQIETAQEMITAYNRAVENDLDIYDEDYDKVFTPTEYELAILHSLPAGYELIARFSTNYLQLKTVYQQRRHHKLPAWQEFCDWCEALPQFLEWTGNKKEQEK